MTYLKFAVTLEVEEANQDEVAADFCTVVENAFESRDDVIGLSIEEVA